MPFFKADRFTGPTTSKADTFAARQAGGGTADVQQTAEAQAMVQQKSAAKTKQEVWAERSEGSNKTLIIVAVAAIAGYFFLKKKKH